MLNSIKGRSALVTGGSKGIGKGIARCLANAGVHVVILSRHVEEGQRAAKEIGKGARALAGDVTDLPTMERAAKATAEAQGGLDVLCANAGMFPPAKLEEMTPEQWDEVVDTNLKGTFSRSRRRCPTSRSPTRAGLSSPLRLPGRSPAFLVGRIMAPPNPDSSASCAPRHRAREIRHHRQRGAAGQHPHRGVSGVGRGVSEDDGRLDPAEEARISRGYRLCRAVLRLQGGRLYHRPDDHRRWRPDPAGIA